MMKVNGNLSKAYIFLQLQIYLMIGSILAQSPGALTFEAALEIAYQNSPDIQQARLALERSRELLNAEEASLKSRFSFTLEPAYYSRVSEFNTDFSQWITTETKRSSGLFTIAQPILLTDGTLALRNQFSWRDSKSDFFQTQSETYSNNLYLAYDQPIFTYNRTRLALEEVKLDLEKTALNYNIRKLQLERQVAQNFYSAYQNKMSLQVAREDYQNRQQSYQIIKNKVDAGLAAQEELFQAELDRTSSKSQLQNQEVALDNALDELKRLLGFEISDEITVFAVISQVSPTLTLSQS